MTSTKKITDFVLFNPKRTIKKGETKPFVEMAALPVDSRDISEIGSRIYKGGGSRFQDGDTLFARITPCLENGKTAKASGLGDGVIAHGSTEFIVMAAKEPEYDEEYVYYLARMPEFRAYAKSRMEGTSGRQRVSWQSLAEFEFDFPDKEDRKEIGRILKSLDDKIQVNNQLNQTLEQIAQAIFKSWFVDFEPVKAKIAVLEAGGTAELAELAAMSVISGKDETALKQLQAEHPEQYAELAQTAALFSSAMVESELGEIPEGWGVTDFGSVSECFDRKRIPLSKRQREKKQGNIPYYGATSIMDYVDEAIFDDIYLLLGEDGSVLKKDGTPFVQYIWGPSWVNNHAHVLQGSNGISTEQLMLFISMQNITAYVTGAVQLKFNQKNMNSIPFIKASDSVNASYQRLIEPLYEEIRTNSIQNKALVEIRDSLLPRLLSSKISVSEVAL